MVQNVLQIPNNQIEQLLDKYKNDGKHRISL